MITRIQQKVLEEYLVNKRKFKSKSERNRFNKTLFRVQKNLDKGFDKLLWLAINCPDIILDEARELEDETLEPHRRLKMIFKIINNLNPRFEVELIIKKSSFQSP